MSPSDLPPDLRPTGATDQAGAADPPSPAAPGGPLITTDPLDNGVAPPPTYRPGASTFTIEGRSAPALFVVGWLATLLGLGLILVAVMSGGGDPARVLLVIGLILLSIGLISAAGSQGIERRVKGTRPYLGPSPFLVFAASIPVSLLALFAVAATVLAGLGISLQSPLAALLSVTFQALTYIALVRLLVVDTGALDWRTMGLRRLDRRAVGEIAGGALWAIPVIAATVPVSLILLAVFPVTPESPLPPTGEPVGFAISLLAGVIVAPFGEEIFFRAFATTAWVRSLGARRGLLRGALVFAFVHVLTISGSNAGDAFGLAVVAFGTRVPIAIALGWIFLRRGSIWASFGLHAAFNGVLLVLAEVASRSL